MNYQYELFVSYRRSPAVGTWVRTHLLPRLQDRLDQNAPFPVRVSCDSDLDSGVNWPEALKNRIRQSGILLAVWSADYFRSSWCMAEWKSFRAREQALGLFDAGDPQGLVYPIRYADGDHFHPEARINHCRADFSKYNYPDESFRLTPKYLEFDDRVTDMAIELVARLQALPPWRSDFPVVEPPALAPAVMLRPVL